MTGFGKAEAIVNGKKIVVEVKSLNSKQLDISLFKIPLIYREKELEIRNILAQNIQRGKVDLFINTELEEVESAPTINKAAFKSYFKQINIIARELDMPMGNEPMIQTILRLPEVFNSQKDEVTQEEWNGLFVCITEALENLNRFRNQEGEITHNDLVQKVEQIMKLLQQVNPFESERVDSIRNRLSENIAKLSNDVSIDKNRFEQELIYYLEKFDINEEKVRLENHCKYFLDTLSEEDQVGRKLGFIAQEMGREINTLGSKANHGEIQKIVVQMKDELEKVKEQLLNVL
jgi:uncharacterized protein (TIGR00255 family)